jgi:hypothetical protein
MTNNQLQIPPNWNTDLLSQFMQLSMHNIFATFHNKKKEYNTLKDINECYQKIIDHLLNTPDLLEGLLLLRSHSAYYAACRLAMSSQVPETFVVLRSSLENALYALHIKKNPTAGEIWLKRHDNEDTLKDTRKEFTYKNVIETLEKTDSSICKTTKNLYERAIDFGAHPNEQAITSSLKLIDTESRREFRQLYLTADDLQLSHGLKSTAQAGLCTLYIFRHIFKERFDIMGITSVMDRYRTKL